MTTASFLVSWLSLPSSHRQLLTKQIIYKLDIRSHHSSGCAVNSRIKCKWVSSIYTKSYCFMHCLLPVTSLDSDTEKGLCLVHCCNSQCLWQYPAYYTQTTYNAYCTLILVNSKSNSGKKLQVCLGRRSFGSRLDCANYVECALLCTTWVTWVSENQTNFRDVSLKFFGMLHLWKSYSDSYQAFFILKPLAGNTVISPLLCMQG